MYIPTGRLEQYQIKFTVDGNGDGGGNVIISFAIEYNGDDFSAPILNITEANVDSIISGISDVISSLDVGQTWTFDTTENYIQQIDSV